MAANIVHPLKKPAPTDRRLPRVFAYDIKDDHQRARVAKVLEAVGDRIQYSVFRADLDDDGVLAVLVRIERRINLGTDRVHVFTLCSGCLGRTRTLGLDPPIVQEFDLE